MKKILSLKKKKIIVSIIILLLSILEAHFSFLQTNFNYLCEHLEQLVQTQRVRIEDCKAEIQLYYLKKGKPQVTSRYPIEIATFYDLKDFKKGVSLLNELSKEHFTKCKVLSGAESCKMCQVIDKNDTLHYTNGEIFRGRYGKIDFKFIYIINEDARVHLEQIEKVWPPLKVMLDQIHSVQASSSYAKFLKKAFSERDLLVQIKFNFKTLKLRTGVATQWVNDVNIKNEILDYYKRNFKLKPMLLFCYNDGFQLVTIDIPMNEYYANIFKQHKHNLQYLKKLYKIEVVAKKWIFMKQWLYKYDSYDRKFPK